MATELVIGVLELQGAFAEHSSMLLRCACPPKYSVKVVGIRNEEDLGEEMDGIVLPGGESTVQGKLLVDLGMMDKMRRMIVGDMVPVFGTCAGAILLSNTIMNNNNKEASIGGLDVAIARNAYGRQIDSHETRAMFAGEELRVVQIRAPMMVETGENVRILASVTSGNSDSDSDSVRAVLVSEKNILAATFHPELTKDCRVHEHFLKMVIKHKEGVADYSCDRE